MLAPSPSPPTDPAAERLLADLKARLAAKPAATSWLAEIEHREHEQRRQRRVDPAGTGALAEVFATVADDATQRPQLTYASGADGRDVREESDWFRALPEKERHRLHQAWAGKRTHGTAIAVGQRRNGNRRMIAAWVVFAATIVLGTGCFWHATLGAGIVCGLWWRHSPPDRFLDPLRAAGTLFVMQGLAMAAHRALNPTLFMDAVLLVGLAAVVGFDGEIRRTGGFDVR